MDEWPIFLRGPPWQAFLDTVKSRKYSGLTTLPLLRATHHEVEPDQHDGDGREHDHDPAWDAAEAEALYSLLEQEVAPAFYDRDPLAAVIIRAR